MTGPSNDGDMSVDILRLTASPARSDRGPSCLSDAVIAALAEASIDPAKRAKALPHISTCDACRTAVLSVSRALADREVADELSAVDAMPRRLYFSALPWAAAAAAAVALFVVWSGSDAPDAMHRAPSSTTTAGVPVPAAPIGIVDRPRVLTWAAVAEADWYRVVMFDSDGRVVYERQQADTFATVPDSVVLVPGRRYVWKVDARLAPNRWTASPLAEFAVGDRPR
jgi:hypothetical protein